MLKLVLNLELERITSSVRRLSRTSRNPFLSMIERCSDDLLPYLVEHIHTYVNGQSELHNVIKDEYLAVVVKWIIVSSIRRQNENNFSAELSKYILTLLHNQQFPRVQKSIVNGLNSVFIHTFTFETNIFLCDDLIINLKKVICSWNTYSESVVITCLLTYGNCRIKVKKCEMSQKK